MVEGSSAAELVVDEADVAGVVEVDEEPAIDVLDDTVVATTTETGEDVNATGAMSATSTAKLLFPKVSVTFSAMVVLTVPMFDACIVPATSSPVTVTVEGTDSSTTMA